MALAGARGLVDQHEAFRRGDEHWLADRPNTDFSLYGADVGFVGFGQIAQELTRLMGPFQPRCRAFDPWLPASVAEAHGVELAPLENVLRQSRCLFVAAAPTSENYHLLNAERLALLKSNALLIVLSRAHLVDFTALDAGLASGRIRACIDVFPAEPVAKDAAIRQAHSAILSPHRAAAVDKGRQLIGDMILNDLKAIASDVPARMLSRANQDTIAALTGVGDAKSVTDMAQNR
ncbi:MAG: NAD(P)-dependent oxidoreductase [Paracoccaceae bacterium]|nr:NAD(P)-dependent oxidoreductase [Octadecabacter sp.]MDG2259991.1 NAD(P)-dependent oxidoreductase [Paracoccaceae bacterium]